MGRVRTDRVADLRLLSCRVAWWTLGLLLPLACGGSEVRAFGGKDDAPEPVSKADQITSCAGLPPPDFQCESGPGTTYTPKSCTTNCYDADDLRWSATCANRVCRCAFEGVTYCECKFSREEDVCDPCCPGLSAKDISDALSRQEQ